MNSFYKIAIDGPSSSGKSTVTKKIAEINNFTYISTGSYFRAFAYILIQNNLTKEKPKEMADFLSDKKIIFDNDQVFYQDINITNLIKEIQISSLASKISQYQEVREIFKNKIQEFSKEKNVVMDGRDIGTVIMPDANIKIFLVASTWTRAKRRNQELKLLHKKTNFFLTYFSLLKRDLNDKYRKVSPLKKAKDAIKINTSHLSIDQTVNEIQKLIKGEHLC